MKMHELVVTCCYSTKEKDIVQIIQSSFDTFLKKELQNVAKYLCTNV